MPLMNAQEAADISKKNLQTVAIEPYLTEISRRVEEAAKQGRNSITHPFSIDNKYARPQEQDAIKQALRNAGYKVTDHPDPDPGYPGSSAYTEVSW